MEDKVEYLENELVKVSESFSELAYHYSTLHNFMIFQFGDVFKNFVMNDADADIKEKGAGEDFEEEGESKDQSLEDGNEEENDGKGELNEYNGQDGNHKDFDADLDIDANMYEEEEEGQEDEPVVEITRVPQRIIQRQIPTILKSRKAGYSGTQTGRVPPPLHRRPMNPRGPSQPAFRGNAVGPSTRAGQQSRAASTVRLIGHPEFKPVTRTLSNITSKPVIGGNRGNEILLSNDDEDFKAGKYAKFYRKVNEELIQCKMCNKILKRRGKFIQHLRTHTGEKPFTCEYCPAAFSRKDNMNVHVAKHHANGEGGSGRSSQHRMPSTSSSLYSYQCPFCYKPFSSESIYTAHLQLVHQENFVNDDDEMEEVGEGEGWVGEEEEGDEGEAYYQDEDGDDANVYA